MAGVGPTSIELPAPVTRNMIDMKKLLITGITMATFAFVAPSAQANSDDCFKRSLAGERVTCVASTSDRHVEEAVIETGAYSRGTWILMCATSRGNVSRQIASIGPATRVVVPVPHRDCALTATVASQRVAAAHVELRSVGTTVGKQLHQRRSQRSRRSA